MLRVLSFHLMSPSITIQSSHGVYSTSTIALRIHCPGLIARPKNCLMTHLWHNLNVRFVLFYLFFRIYLSAFHSNIGLFKLFIKWITYIRNKLFFGSEIFFGLVLKDKLWKLTIFKNIIMNQDYKYYTIFKVKALESFHLKLMYSFFQLQHEFIKCMSSISLLAQYR